MVVIVVELQKCWGVSKSNFELGMPLEDASPITHPPIVACSLVVSITRTGLSNAPLKKLDPLEMVGDLCEVELIR